MIVLANFLVFNIAKKNKTIVCWQTFWDSVKLACESTFVDALGSSASLKSEFQSLNLMDKIYQL